MTIRHLSVIALSAVLGGCSLTITYTDKLSPTSYRVRVNGNAYSEAHHLQEKLASRATKICKGSAYEVSDQKYETAYVYSGTPIRTPMLTMEAVVTCTPTDAPSKT